MALKCDSNSIKDLLCSAFLTSFPIIFMALPPADNAGQHAWESPGFRLLTCIKMVVKSDFGELVVTFLFRVPCN